MYGTVIVSSGMLLPMKQHQQSQWTWQWNHLQDDNRWLFSEWIFPNTWETFRGKTVLDCGCGGGQHVSFVAPVAKSVVGVDLNATESAIQRTKNYQNVRILQDDIAKMQLNTVFDVVYSIGVLHHTDDPDASFANIASHCAAGGRVIVWVYSKEGNFLNQYVLEPVKYLIIRHLPRRMVLWLAWILTLLVSLPVHTIYRLPLRSLPYYQYFQNWRQLSLSRNMLNVFDKLNAPQTWFISEERIRRWFGSGFRDVHISPYRGVSWRGSGTRLEHA